MSKGNISFLDTEIKSLTHLEVVNTHLKFTDELKN